MNSIVQFSNEFASLRAVTINGDPWFVAADVCEALTISTEATRRLDDDEKGLHTTQTLGGQQEMTVINESGLYSLILTSRKPEAKKFKKWVTSEVLPSIRKTGGYALGSSVRRDRQSSEMREASLIAKYNLQTLKLFGVAPEMATVITAKMVKEYTGVDYMPHLTGYISVEDKPLTPTQLGQLMDGMTPRAVNDWLVRRNLQVKDAKGNYLLTELGKQYGVMEPFQSATSKHAGYRVKWYRRVASVEAPKGLTDAELEAALTGVSM